LISPILIAITKTPYKDIITLLTVFYYELTLYSSVAFFPAIVFKKSSNKKKKTFYKHTIIQRNIAILFESWERIWYNPCFTVVVLKSPRRFLASLDFSVFESYVC